jgi:putative flippase GtrA
MQQGIRYVVVGGYNTVFGVAVFVALDLILADYIGHYLVLTIATVIGVANSHATQRRFVWLSSDTYLHELGRFSAVYAGFFFVNLLLLYVAHSVLAAPVIPAQIVITLIVVVSTFMIHRVWTFGPRRSPEDVPERRLR